MIPVIVFPFDLYGNNGTGAGAMLLADVVKEILDDAETEARPQRAEKLKGKVELHEVEFDSEPVITKWRKTGKDLAKKNLTQHPFTLWLGGNHLSVLPVYEALGPEDMVVQLDAHLDCYEFHDTSKHLSPGNFLRELGPKKPQIVNLGHRDLFLLDKEINKYYAATISVTDFAISEVNGMLAFEKLLMQPERIWVDIDVDVFDPMFLPAVHNPVPFGLTPLFVLKLMQALPWEKVAGVSFSEFDPGRDRDNRSLETLMWLMEWILLRQV